MTGLKRESEVRFVCDEAAVQVDISCTMKAVHCTLYFKVIYPFINSVLFIKLKSLQSKCVTQLCSQNLGMTNISKNYNTYPILSLF